MATFPNTSGIYSVAPEISNDSLDIWPVPGDPYHAQTTNFTVSDMGPGQGISLDVSIEMMSDDGGPNCVHWSPISSSPPLSPCRWSCSDCPAESCTMTPDMNCIPSAIWCPGDHVDDGNAMRTIAGADDGRGKIDVMCSPDARTVQSSVKDKPALQLTDIRATTPKEDGDPTTGVDPQCIISAIWLNTERSRVSVTRTNQTTEASYGLWCSETGENMSKVESRGTLPGLWMSDGEHIVTAQRSRTRQTEEFIMRIGGRGGVGGGISPPTTKPLPAAAAAAFVVPRQSRKPKVDPVDHTPEQQQEAECICGGPLVPCALQCGISGKRRNLSPPPAVEGNKGDDISCMRLPTHDTLSTIWTVDGKQCIAFDDSHPASELCPSKGMEGANLRNVANDDALSTIWTLDGEQSLSLNTSHSTCPLNCCPASNPKKDDNDASQSTIWTLDGNPSVGAKADECMCPTNKSDESTCARRIATNDSMSTVWSLDGKHGFALERKQNVSSDGGSSANECPVSSYCAPPTISFTKKPPNILSSSGLLSKDKTSREKRPLEKRPSDRKSLDMRPLDKRLANIKTEDMKPPEINPPEMKPPETMSTDKSPSEGSPDMRPPDTKSPDMRKPDKRKPPPDVKAVERNSPVDAMLVPERDVAKCSIAKLESREERYSFSSHRKKVSVDLVSPRTRDERNCTIAGDPLYSMSVGAATAAASISMEKKQSGLSDQSADFPRDECSLRSSGTSSTFRKEGPRCSISTLSSDRGNVFPDRDYGAATAERCRPVQQSISANRNESRPHMSTSSTSSGSNKSNASETNADRFTLRTIKEVPFVIRTESSSEMSTNSTTSKWKVVAEFNVVSPKEESANSQFKDNTMTNVLKNESPQRERSRSPDVSNTRVMMPPLDNSTTVRAALAPLTPPSPSPPPPCRPSPALTAGATVAPSCSGGHTSPMECVRNMSPDRVTQFARLGSKHNTNTDDAVGGWGPTDVTMSGLRSSGEGSTAKRNDPLSSINTGVDELKPLALIRRGGGGSNSKRMADSKRTEPVCPSSKSSFSSSASDSKGNAATPSATIVEVDSSPQRTDPLCPLSLYQAPMPTAGDCDGYSVTIDLRIDSGGEAPVRMVITDDARKSPSSIRRAALDGGPTMPRIEPYCSLSSYSSPNERTNMSTLDNALGERCESNYSPCCERPTSSERTVMRTTPAAVEDPSFQQKSLPPCSLSTPSAATTSKKRVCEHKRNCALNRPQSSVRTVKDVRCPSPRASGVNSLSSGFRTHGACKHTHNHARHHQATTHAAAAASKKEGRLHQSEDKLSHHQQHQKTKEQSSYGSRSPSPPLPEIPLKGENSRALPSRKRGGDVLFGKKNSCVKTHSKCKLAVDCPLYSWSGEDELNPPPKSPSSSDWSRTEVKQTRCPRQFADEWSTRTPDDSSSVTSLEARRCLSQGKETKAMTTAAAAAAKSSSSAPPPPSPHCPRHSNASRKSTGAGATAGGSRCNEETSSPSSRSPSATRRQKQQLQQQATTPPATPEAWSAADTNDDEPLSIKSRKSSFTSTESKPCFSSEEMSQESCPMSSVHWRTKSSSSGSEDKKEVVSELVRIRPLNEGPLTLPLENNNPTNTNKKQSAAPPPPPPLPPPSTRRPPTDWRPKQSLNEDLHFMHEDNWRERVFMDELSTETEPWPTMSTMSPLDSRSGCIRRVPTPNATNPSSSGLKNLLRCTSKEEGEEEDEEEEEELLGIEEEEEEDVDRFCDLSRSRNAGACSPPAPIALAAAVSAPAQTSPDVAAAAVDRKGAWKDSVTQSSESVLETGRVLSTIWSSDGKTSNDSEQGRIIPSDECTDYGLHVAHRIREYSQRTRSLVQLQINDVLFRADTGQLEPSPSMELEPGADSCAYHQDELYDTAEDTTEWGAAAAASASSCFPYRVCAEDSKSRHRCA